MKQKRLQVITGLNVFWCSIRHVDFTIVLGSTTLQYEQLCCTFVMYFGEEWNNYKIFLDLVYFDLRTRLDCTQCHFPDTE